MSKIKGDLGTGDLFVANTLRSWGYEIEILSISGLVAIQASKPSDKLLVYVVSATHPNEPEMPSFDQTSRLNKYARTTGAKVWIAKVQLDQDLNLRGGISWEKSSQ